MVLFPNVKINIGLHIVEKRPDGYHNLESCFYPVGWTDLLEAIPADEFSFTMAGATIPGDPSTNLCVKAYHLLKQDFDLPPMKLHLHKLIPVGAGLGGGSSDAAFTLKLLNQQFKLGIPTEQLEAYARQLGSDCAFFIQNRPLYCTEKGDQFSEIDLSLRGYTIVLVYPNLAISTAEAYAGVHPRKPVTDLRTLLQAPLTDWRHTIHNDFTDSLYPKYAILPEIEQRLYDEGAIYASMSGSGSTIYGVFDQPPVLSGYFNAYQVWQEAL